MKESSALVANILTQALPYIKHHRKKSVVIKYGGNAMIDNDLQKSFAQDMVLLKLVGVNVIVVHGGGPQIGKLLEALNIESHFVDGMRVTDSATMDVVEMVLGGKVNKQIVGLINSEGGKAVGLTGKDGQLIKARRLKSSRQNDELGQVGEVESMDVQILHTLAMSDCIPVVAPVGYSESGESLNINADLVAGKLAQELSAEKLVLLTNTPGILDQEGNTLTHLTPANIRSLKKQGVVHSGMLPKVDCALQALESGVNRVHIIDGRVEHAALLELLTDSGVGTLIENK